MAAPADSSSPGLGIMRAMVFERPGSPLIGRDITVPEAAPGEVLIQVNACAVCRTDLHVVDGDLAEPKLPLVPGHEIIGTIVAAGPGTGRFAIGSRVGVGWLGATCGDCGYCRSGRENLCPGARFTGYHIDGGFAEYTVANETHCFAIPQIYGDVEAAPLMCAGLIGYRALAMAGDARRLGIYGFGAAAHIVAQVAHHQGREVYAFTRPGDRRRQQFARQLGVAWTGDSTVPCPQALDAALIFAPVGALVPAALAAVAPGGVVVCAGIHMSDIPGFAYELLWGERCLRSVANLTRRDGEDFLALAARTRIQTTTHAYPLDQANAALDQMRHGQLTGAAVLDPGLDRQIG